ncbi:MAG: 4a-hydroxytetrahydrobiopterin dehydratase [Chloroflexi bacterium]|nr:4a-hydroxytetrahydrobiopterin dehydratase [Chloroflexota bacterium]
MRIPPVLSSAGLQSSLHTLHGWRLLSGRVKKLRKSYSLGSLRDAMDFVNEVARLAEEENHHPDIDVRYNRVTLTLWTHAKGGLTELDLHLAQRIDGVVKTG